MSFRFEVSVTDYTSLYATGALALVCIAAGLYRLIKSSPRAAGISVVVTALVAQVIWAILLDYRIVTPHAFAQLGNVERAWCGVGILVAAVWVLSFVVHDKELLTPAAGTHLKFGVAFTFAVLFIGVLFALVIDRLEGMPNTQELLFPGLMIAWIAAFVGLVRGAFLHWDT